ncbi:hypothetical protein AS189_03075 [Arthrobacter alpinus]|uniref:WXG100 family type VII secretion target n=1 Tax=Arthrobacter alpinus TaxID=656366 RepID=A0A0S2LWV2_9MICC|nr:hypothetical protein [Arthrobacter alpinus]ALO65659.1 hypothetical protein AS189_03075 [Arthrobacter alpinus]
MDGFIGADIADLRDFAKAMDKASHALLLQAQTLSNAVNQPHGWKGPDADRFRQSWNTSHRPTIAATSRSLQQAADMLRKDATEQEAASSVASLDGTGEVCVDPTLQDSGWNPQNTLIDWGKGLVGLGLKVNDVVKYATSWKGYLSDKKIFDLKGKLPNFGKFGDDFKNALGVFTKADGIVGKIGTGIKAFGRFAGVAAAPFAIGGGIHDMFWPDHDGGRGAMERISGGMSVVAGGGSLLMAVGLLTNPVGIGIVVGAGVIAAGWAVGNLIADTEWGQAMGRGIANAAGNVFDGAKEAVGSVVEGANNVVDGAKNFFSNPVKSLGGLFT